MSESDSSISQVQNLAVENTGLFTALANVAAVIVKVLGGPVSDLATCVSPKNRVKLFTLLSQVAFSGLMWVGPVKSGAIVSMQHSHFVFLIVQFINSVGIIVLPPFVNGIAYDNSWLHWQIILLSIFGSVVICTAVFLFTGEAEPASWTKPRPDYRHRRTTTGDLIVPHPRLMSF
ncbi:unnamed protein product [Anisakis simplex]|uniref:Major facilitator superfamily (MFS) profile domain-containing protein n=1 Tax=Anisakis simplex TaxID=6269 RepID=A0A3P6UBV5_ANISI|nr:unnamed protein product [Anisakis simplex]